MCKGIDLTQSSSLERIPTLIAAFGAALLVISVAYDYGFLLWLGVSLSEVPTSLSDHIRSSLVWAPSMVIVFFGIFVIELFNRRIEQGMTEEELINKSPVPSFTAWFRESPRYLIVAFALFLLATPFLKIELPLQAWMLGSIIWWFILHNFFFGHRRILERTTKLFYWSSRWVPATMLYVVFSGAVSAEKVPMGDVYTFNVQGKERAFILVRSYDKYFMVWSPDTKNVVFLSASSVLSFHPEQKETSKKTIQPTPKSVAADD